MKLNCVVYPDGPGAPVKVGSALGLLSLDFGAIIFRPDGGVDIVVVVAGADRVEVVVVGAGRMEEEVVVGAGCM